MTIAKIKVLHVARRFVSQSLEELNTGYDMEHFKAMAKLLEKNSVIFQSKDKKRYEKKIGNLEIFLVKNLAAIFLAIQKIGKQHDLIVAQNPFIAGFLAVIAGIIIKKPVIVSVHGYEFTVSKLQLLLKKFTCSKATIIRANSKIVKDTIVSWGINSNKIVIIEDRVDCEHFSPNVNGIEIRDKLKIKNKMVLSVGSLIEIKGFDTLLESISLVKEEIDGIKFVIVGEGILKNHLSKMVEKLGISENVIFTGNINYQNLPKYYAASDLFVHPSYVESMGRVILEAQASGKPVVATNVGGIPEAVSKESAILVPPKNSKELSNSIIKVLKNENLIQDMSSKGRKLMLESFEFWKQEQKLIDFYESVVNKFKTN